MSDDPLTRLCESWLLTVKSFSQCAHRFVTCNVEDENQSVRIIMQYVFPIEPPDIRESVFTRFVARIPFLEDVHASEV